ncbi:hypothetical protein RIF25_08440 [Thermosynechococcaceae cyanobacterium BACA0444]|uniref:Uncharacterized protein n=1 Tax=Pseudocalidococcus azoricus BACA0444 TaxID=2918990 RepID=A0AAE4FTT2_9CYAN|nr:hypothetical protein [Pseudocalidococcus azoricus]MDS3860841.1 hypothetical protein [Pseudocalidococcus azoricus BACA0444]
MSEPNDTIQVLERLTVAMTDLHREVSLIKHDLQELRGDVRVNQATTVEQLKSLNDKFEGLRSEIKEDVAELRDRQKGTDARLWLFLGGLVTLLGGGLWGLIRLVLPVPVT